MNITGVKGLTPGTISTLKALGAVENVEWEGRSFMLASNHLKWNLSEGLQYDHSRENHSRFIQHG